MPENSSPTTGQPGEARRSAIRAFWDGRAARYDECFDENGGDAHALRARLRATIQLVGAGPGTALDAGMGPGRLCAELAHLGWTVSGVDASAEMVALARSPLPVAASRLVQATIEALPFPDCSFDRATATGVLEYADVPAALSELARVLRPGGLAVVSYPNPHALYRMWKAWLYYPVVRGARRLGGADPIGLPHGAGAIPPTSFVTLLRGAGLEPVSLTPTSVLPVVAPLDSAFPRLAAAMAQRLEGSKAIGSSLATQIVYTARRPVRSRNASSSAV